MIHISRAKALQYHVFTELDTNQVCQGVHMRTASHSTRHNCVATDSLAAAFFLDLMCLLRSPMVCLATPCNV